jgi:hypothetical protein
MPMPKSEAGRLGALRTHEVMREQRLERIRAYVPISCLRCGTPIPYDKRKNKFCNTSCAASFNNLGVAHNGVKIEDRSCLDCGVKLRRRYGRKYCSYKCQQDFARKIRIKRWLAGEISGGSWHGVTNWVRYWLVRQFGEKCVKCGWAEVNPATGRIPVQVEHRDGDPNNHSPENLCLLCPNCHSLTSTFGGLNKGYGRSQRYKK